MEACQFRLAYVDPTMSPRFGDDFDHPWLIDRIPEETLGRYRKAMFRVRSSNEPLVILDSLAEMQDILHQIERAAVEEARAQGATWSQVAQALNRTRQAVEQLVSAKRRRTSAAFTLQGPHTTDRWASDERRADARAWTSQRASTP